MKKCERGRKPPDEHPRLQTPSVLRTRQGTYVPRSLIDYFPPKSSASVSDGTIG